MQLNQDLYCVAMSCADTQKFAACFDPAEASQNLVCPRRVFASSKENVSNNTSGSFSRKCHGKRIAPNPGAKRDLTPPPLSALASTKFSPKCSFETGNDNSTCADGASTQVYSPRRTKAEGYNHYHVENGDVQVPTEGHLRAEGRSASAAQKQKRPPYMCRPVLGEIGKVAKR